MNVYLLILSNPSVSDLKTLLKQRSLPTSGSKAQLLERLKQHNLLGIPNKRVVNLAGSSKSSVRSVSSNSDKNFAFKSTNSAGITSNSPAILGSTNSVGVLGSMNSAGISPSMNSAGISVSMNSAGLSASMNSAGILGSSERGFQFKSLSSTGLPISEKVSQSKGSSKSSYSNSATPVTKFGSMTSRSSDRRSSCEISDGEVFSPASVMSVDDRTSVTGVENLRPASQNNQNVGNNPSENGASIDSQNGCICPIETLSGRSCPTDTRNNGRNNQQPSDKLSSIDQAIDAAGILISNSARNASPNFSSLLSSSCASNDSDYSMSTSLNADECRGLYTGSNTIMDENTLGEYRECE